MYSYKMYFYNTNIFTLVFWLIVYNHLYYFILFYLNNKSDNVIFVDNKKNTDSWPAVINTYQLK